MTDNRVTRSHSGAFKTLLRRNDIDDSQHNKRYSNIIHVGGKWGKIFNVSKSACFEKARLLVYFVAELVDRHDELDPKTCGFNLSDSEPSLSLGLN
jgi:hypothetical protein